MTDVDHLLRLYQDAHAPDPALVSKLPKGKGRGNQNESCNVCGGWHKPGMFHLDYVGHADVTRILLEHDPLWSWTPMALADDGTPRITQRGNVLELWILLTVHGRTLPAVGTCQSGKDEAAKELIGDAIRNGAMRFGVALDLWSKADLDAVDDTATEAPAAPQETMSPALRAMNALAASGIPDDRFADVFGLYQDGATSIGELSDGQAEKLIGNLASDKAFAKILDKLGVEVTEATVTF